MGKSTTTHTPHGRPTQCQHVKTDGTRCQAKPMDRPVPHEPCSAFCEESAMSFRRPDAHQACGAINRHGQSCKNWPARQSHSLKRRCRFHGGHSLQGLAHPHFRHGKRTRGLREVATQVCAAGELSWQDLYQLTTLVREKRAELVALVLTIAEVRGMTKAETRASLGIPLSPDDVVRR